MNRLEKEAYELQEKDIEQYLNEALPELNIRLWADMYGGEIEDRKTKMLWLESITLTSYTPHHNKGRIINRIMGKLALKLPFTLKKYRKERR
ncbi:MAG: hypothetical protein K2K46_00970 [Lachnospiraceae bacterium]|nr:hypothetical protein [Lachnospiraceae bacterium]